MNGKQIICIMILICGLCAFITGGILEYSVEEQVKLGNCYDRYGSQIMGEHCIIKYHDEELIGDSVLVWFIGFLSMGMGFAGVIVFDK